MAVGDTSQVLSSSSFFQRRAPDPGTLYLPKGSNNRGVTRDKTTTPDPTTEVPWLAWASLAGTVVSWYTVPPAPALASAPRGESVWRLDREHRNPVESPLI
ncbi:hypothetical protein CSOJ01_09616 [Colletotrichum sojae]|uniref:Uncharacterized protein n=1 Tax=Colletotrichum sojae TaxID=2175907 RepID=A0A8H6J2H3_9PEZI|nr:hypothetical protein CSOJ01_09616 [Colletotrichum sojae]